MDEHTDKRHRCELQLQRVETEFKQIEERIWEDYELTYALAEPFRQADFRLGESEKRISAIRARIREMGVVNVSALDEYRQTVQRLEEMTSQRDDLQRAELDLQNIVEELERKMESQFKREFAILNQNFQRTFVKLFGGGRAELTLSDPNDALNCDIDVVAQPPGKKLQLLTLLSGGERALTAIAILFAMLDLKPTPFCILDEIEAALDDANIDNYADYLRALFRKHAVRGHHPPQGHHGALQRALWRGDGGKGRLQAGIGILERSKLGSECQWDCLTASRRACKRPATVFSGHMDELVENYKKLDDEFFEDLSDILIMADVGMKTTELAVSRLREKCKAEKIGSAEQAREALKEILADMMRTEPMRLETPDGAARHRRQRRGQDHHHRQAGHALQDRGPPRGHLRRGHLPRRRRRAADHLGRARRRAHHQAEGGRRPCRRGV